MSNDPLLSAGVTDIEAHSRFLTEADGTVVLNSANADIKTLAHYRNLFLAAAALGGIDGANPVQHVASFTVDADAMWKLHQLEPALGQIIEVTLPPADAFPNAQIAFDVPWYAYGQVLFKTAGANSNIEDFSNDTFLMWHRESGILKSYGAQGWGRVGWVHNHAQLDSTLNSGGDVELSALTTPYTMSFTADAQVSTWRNAGAFLLDGAGTPRLVRRGEALWDLTAYFDYTAAPTLLYIVDTNGDGGNAPHNRFFLEGDDNDHYVRARNNFPSAPASMNLQVHWVGGTDLWLRNSAISCRFSASEVEI